MQIVFTGDFYQLPPVGNHGETDTSRFCFESDLWNNLSNLSILIEIEIEFISDSLESSWLQ